MRMLTGVAIRRAIAAKCDAAFLTGAQMHPLRADLHTLGAFANFWLFDGCNRVEMRAAPVRHHLILAALDERPQQQSNLRLLPQRLV